VSGLTVAKLAVNIVSSLGVSKILSDVIKNNTTIETVVDKILVHSGSLVLGTMVVSKASDHVNATMDGAINKIRKSKEEAEVELNKEDEEPPIVEGTATVQP
jgi:DNA transposition AAA+ family ATPase